MREGKVIVLEKTRESLYEARGLREHEVHARRAKLIEQLRGPFGRFAVGPELN
jgi:hypothetical protein